MKLLLKFEKDEVERASDGLRDWSNYNQKYELYALTKTMDWSYSQKRPRKGDTISGKGRIYLHLYFNSEKTLKEEKDFNARLINLQEELLSGKRRPEH